MRLYFSSLISLLAVNFSFFYIQTMLEFQNCIFKLMFLFFVFFFLCVVSSLTINGDVLQLFLFYHRYRLLTVLNY